jgi:hypothetical protein
MHKDNPNCHKTYAVLMRVPVSQQAGAKADRKEITKSSASPMEPTDVSSEDKVQSTDLEDHLQYICDAESKNYDVRVPKSNRFETELHCYWISTGILGGGPILGPEILSRISELADRIIFHFAYKGEVHAES